ncbi:hypothetical protein JQU41_00930 [Ponticoccus sp. SC6-36]|nr:hypothetical protein [Ponticoccus sp. SC6-36]
MAAKDRPGCKLGTVRRSAKEYLVAGSAADRVMQGRLGRSRWTRRGADRLTSGGASLFEQAASSQVFDSK